MKLAVAAVLLVSTATLALAADPKGPAPVHDWRGVYLGAFGGFGAGEVFSDTVPPFAPATAQVSGAVIGGTVGYNWQMGNLVLGVEADGAWSDIHGGTPCPNPFVTCAEALEWAATLRGRFGHAWDRVLIYATAGLALGGERSTIVVPVVGAVNRTEMGTHSGYVVGGGIEIAVTSRVSVKSEYQLLDFTSRVAEAGTLDAGFPIQVWPTVHVGKFGVNFHF